MSNLIQPGATFNSQLFQKMDDQQQDTKLFHQPKTAKERTTAMIRQMHKEKIINQLKSNFNQKNAMFAPKPDYGKLISKKFCQISDSDQDNEDEKNGEILADNAIVSDSDSYNDDDNVRISSRGQKNLEAPVLRVARFERILASRSDLTKEERNSLRSRKNTAIFREHKKQK